MVLVIISSSLQAAIVQGVMVAHSEEDLLCIRAAYLKLTGTSLYSALQASLAQNKKLLFEFLSRFAACVKAELYPNRNSSREITFRLCWPSVALKINRQLHDRHVRQFSCFVFFSGFFVRLCSNKLHFVATFHSIPSFLVQHVRQTLHGLVGLMDFNVNNSGSWPFRKLWQLNEVKAQPSVYFCFIYWNYLVTYFNQLQSLHKESRLCKEKLWLQS